VRDGFEAWGQGPAGWVSPPQFGGPGRSAAWRAPEVVDTDTRAPWAPPSRLDSPASSLTSQVPPPFPALLHSTRGGRFHRGGGVGGGRGGGTGRASLPPLTLDSTAFILSLAAGDNCTRR